MPEPITSRFIAIAPRPDAPAGPASPEIRLSPAFREAAAGWIGDWLHRQSKGLPKEQQAMVKSMLAHLTNNTEGKAVWQGPRHIAFEFLHPHKTAIGFMLDDAGARQRRLGGVLNVNSGGEVAGFSIVDPRIVADDRDVANPGTQSAKRGQPEHSALRVQAMMKRQRTSHETSCPLAIRYVDVGLTPEARQTLDALNSGFALPVALPILYDKLRSLSGETGRNWRENLGRVLNGFASFVQGTGKNIQDLMANFHGYASHAAAYQEASRKAGVGQKPSARDIRYALHHLCTLSFGARPMDHYVKSKMEDPASLLHDLPGNSGKEAEGKYRFEASNIYLLDSHCAATGFDSAAELFETPGGFIKVMSAILDENRGNASLKQFLSYLLVDAFDAGLGKAVLKAVDDYSAKLPGTGMKMSDSASRAHRKNAMRLAAYACAKQMSYEAFRELLRQPRESAEILAARNWIGVEDSRRVERQFHMTVNALNKHLPLRLPDRDSAVRQAAHGV